MTTTYFMRCKNISYHQKSEKFQKMPEVPELVSGVLAGVCVAGDDSAGVIAGVIKVADAASPLCFGANM